MGMKYIHLSSKTEREREFHKHAEVARCQRFMPVILATWEVEMGRIKV
jgi:hypothetical protein